MLRRSASTLLILIAGVALAGCIGGGGGGGDKTPKATATPEKPGPVDAVATWVRENRNVAFVGDCGEATRGVDVGKLCVELAGDRGTRRAYYLGPVFSQPTALAIVEETPEGWVTLSVNNLDPSQTDVPGIDWPLEVGDRVVIIGVGEGDCLRVRDQPTQTGAQLNCMPDGTEAIVQEGPVEAETFTWWRISGDGFNGWAAGRWLRLPEAIAAALTPRPAGTATPEA
ncbi:MAG: hypothetical protein WEC75_08125 [Dehalococcoidia bacterium]